MELSRLARYPRNVLLLDLIGALTTSLVTGILLTTDRFATGVPDWILYIMAAAALGFAGYDAAGLALSSDLRTPLAVIATLNLLYCAASLVVYYTHANELTLLGKVYFPAEVIVIVLLASWERKLADGSA